MQEHSKQERKTRGSSVGGQDSRGRRFKLRRQRKTKLASAAISGAPEDQLRAPLDAFLRDLAEIAGLPAGSVHFVGETTLAGLKTRPDFAVTVHNALVGFVEVKTPGKGADPRQFDELARLAA